MDASGPMALTGALDEPDEGEIVGGALLVSGWAISTEGDLLVLSVRTDGGPEQPLHRGKPRPDVEAAYPGLGGGAGFAGLVLLEDREGPAEVTVTLRRADSDEVAHLVRPVMVRSSGGTALADPTASTAGPDADLLTWLTTAMGGADGVSGPWPRTTAGAEQLRLALGLEDAFPETYGEQRFSFLEWLFHLWKNGGEDAVPLALVAASWLPEPARATIALAPSWRESTWGHLVLPWLADDAVDPVRGAPVLSRADAIASRSLDPALALSTRPLPPRRAWAPAARPAGINVVGHLQATSGLGEATRSTVRSVVAAGIAHDALDLGPTTEDAVLRSPASLGCPYAVSVLHDNVSRVLVTARLLGPRFLRDRYSVGYWYWEAADPPEETAAASATVDEIWVASQFVADALRDASTVPVHVVPPAIDLEFGLTESSARERFGIPPSVPCFLTMSSVHSTTERKNPFGALEAFRLAFGRSGTTGAVLVMKLTGIVGDPALREELRARIGRLPVIVIEDPLSRSDVRSLISASDVVVSLHRAEGFGLPLAEAMAAGRAVIATDWSGNIDFTTPETAFMVPCEVVELDRDLGPYRRGMHWAEPDITAAADAMRLAVEDVPRRQLIAQAGQDFVRSHYSAEAAAPVVQDQFDRILADMT